MDSLYRTSNNAQSLSNKVAIVTGASRGIGAGIALELARRGAKVTIIYTSSSSDAAVNTMIDQIYALKNGSSAIKIQSDIREPFAPKHIVDEIIHAFGGNIDILVNNAGVELAVLSHLRAPGRIINISSVGARYGFRDLSIYCSSKATLEGLTRCWAAELGAAGHTVNAVNPGPVQTQLMDKIPKDYIEMQKAQTPVENRLGTVDDIAQIVAWLAGEGCRWISGQVLSAGGGWAIY